jgi:multidrug efflux pump subunit AcrA (membrane-fusion protein)
VITERMKNPGESVRANEAVVRMGKIDKLRIQAWVPIEYSFRVKVGMPVEVAPNIPGADLPIERKKFRGKITFVDPEAQPVKTEVRVFAEIMNNEDHDLRPGLKADMVIYLNSGGEPAPRAPEPAVGARDAAQPR